MVIKLTQDAGTFSHFTTQHILPSLLRHHLRDSGQYEFTTDADAISALEIQCVDNPFLDTPVRVSTKTQSVQRVDFPYPMPADDFINSLALWAAAFIRELRAQEELDGDGSDSISCKLEDVLMRVDKNGHFTASNMVAVQTTFSGKGTVSISGESKLDKVKFENCILNIEGTVLCKQCLIQDVILNGVYFGRRNMDGPYDYPIKTF